MEVCFKKCTGVSFKKKCCDGKNNTKYTGFTGDTRGRINSIYSFSISSMKNSLKNYFAIDCEDLTQLTQLNDSND